MLQTPSNSSSAPTEKYFNGNRLWYLNGSGKHWINDLNVLGEYLQTQRSTMFVPAPSSPQLNDTLAALTGLWSLKKSTNGEYPYHKFSLFDLPSFPFIKNWVADHEKVVGREAALVYVMAQSGSKYHPSWHSDGKVPFYPPLFISPRWPPSHLNLPTLSLSPSLAISSVTLPLLLPLGYDQTRW